MNYLIDIGNTICKTAKLFDDGNLACIEKYKEEAELFEHIPEGIDKIVLSTVRADNYEFNNKLAEKCRKLIIVDVDYTKELLKKRSDVRYLDVLEKMPDGMGADRIAAILASHYLFENEDLIVFDFGTATTVEIINKAGGEKKAEYLGGVISLGLQTRYRAISHFTKRIPLCNPEKYIGKPISCTANNLDDALAAGNILGIKFEIDGYISMFSDRKVVFTGGNSVYFTDRVDKPVHYVKNLVLIGLALIAQYDV